MNLDKNASVKWSFILGLAALFLDRIQKTIQIDFFGWKGGESVSVFPFFDYILVWNTGISYGMFNGFAPEILLGIMGLAIVALGYWWYREDGFLTRIGIALALGGALSNAIDRIIWGAVADFFHFFIGEHSWYVFNIADVAICIGVVILVIDVIRPHQKNKKSSK